MKRYALILVLILSATLPSFAQRELKPGFNLFSKEQDVQLGREAATQIEKETSLVDDPALNEYITGIGKKLAAQAEADDYPYTFKVVNDKNINAFALPGGPTYVNTGLILAAQNEAQLAGVLAHEISHVALRHGTNQASKSSGLQMIAMIAASAVGDKSILSQLAQLGIGIGANSVLMKYSRNAERDADLLGARMMAGSGYNPIEMARFFETLEAAGGSRSGFAQFLSSHPNPGSRMSAVEEEIQYLPQRNYSADTGRLQAMKARAAKLPEPTPPAETQQAIGNTSLDPSARPSGRFLQYQGREYTLVYPDNWQAHADPNSNVLTLAPSSGLVQTPDGPTAIGYGAVAGYYKPSGQRIALSGTTRTLIQELQKGNPEMRASRSRSLQVAGQRALATTLYGASPFKDEKETDTLVTIARPEGLFYILFVAPESEDSQSSAAFDRMTRSLRFSR